MRKDLATFLVGPQTSLAETMRAINEGGVQIALVVDEERRLLGTATDGDIRRALLQGASLTDPVQTAMNPHPVTAPLTTPPEEVFRLLRQRHLLQMPLLDSQGKVVGLKLLEDFLEPEGRENFVIIMAGGEGSRLAPLTLEMPKPMLKVGGKPLLEILIEQLRTHGLRNVLLAVNYKSEQITNYCQDGRQYGVRLGYLLEEKPLGTAGAIALAKAHLQRPFLVVNGDLLTLANFGELLRFHETNAYAMTVCIRENEVQVPYGVVQVHDSAVTGIQEKPTSSYYINAGIYVLNPQVVDLVPEGEYFEMPQLIQRALERGERVGSFLLREYWLDIGHWQDYQRAQADFGRYFQP